MENQSAWQPARTRRRRSCLLKPRHSPQPSGARSLAQSTQDAEARRHTQRRARQGKQTRRCGRRRRPGPPETCRSTAAWSHESAPCAGCGKGTCAGRVISTYRGRVQDQESLRELLRAASGHVAPRPFAYAPWPEAILAMRHAACTHMLCRTEYPMHTQDTYDTKHTQNRNRGYRLGLPQRVQVPPWGPLKVWRAFFWLMMRVLIDWFCVKDATCSPSPSVHAQLRQGQRDIPWAPGRCAAREGRRGQDIPAAPATSGACPEGE